MGSGVVHRIQVKLTHNWVLEIQILAAQIATWLPRVAQVRSVDLEGLLPSYPWSMNKRGRISDYLGNKLDEC